MVGYNAFPLQDVLDFIMDGLDLPLGLTATYHEIVSKAAYFSGIQQYSINSLLITGSFYYPMCYC